MATINIGKQVFEGQNVQVADVSTQDPETNIGRFHSIQQPRFESSLAPVLEGAGQAIKKGTELAYALEDTAIKNYVYPRADAIKNQEIADLQGIKGAVTTPTQSLIQSDNANTAANVKTDVARNLGFIQSLRDNGTYSPTMKAATELAFLKDTRAAFSHLPGMREEIDSTVEKALNQPAANRVIAGLTGDINTALSNQKTERNKIESQIFEAMPFDHNLSALWSDWKAGKVSDQYILDRAASARQKQHDLTYATGVLALEKASEESRQRAAGKVADIVGSKIVSGPVQDMLAKNGITEKPDEFAREIQTNPRLARQHYQTLLTQEPLLDRQLEAALDEPLKDSNNKVILQADGKTPQTLRAHMTGAQIATWKKEQMAPIEALKGVFNDPQGGYLFAATQGIKDTETAASANLLANPTIGPNLLMLKTIEQWAGPQAAMAVQKEIQQTVMQIQNPAVRGSAFDFASRAATGTPDRNGAPSVKQEAEKYNLFGMSEPAATQFIIQHPIRQVLSPTTLK